MLLSLKGGLFFPLWQNYVLMENFFSGAPETEVILGAKIHCGIDSYGETCDVEGVFTGQGACQAGGRPEVPARQARLDAGGGQSAHGTANLNSVKD
jgi:hypothetical protein